MAIKRNRHKQSVSFDERLHKAARDAREEAGQLPSGPQRDLLLKKAGQAENAAHLNEWLSSPSAHPVRLGPLARSKIA